MVISEERLRGLAKRLGECMVARKITLAAAESCTGGWVAKVITDLPGSSAWFDSSVVSYSNEAKRSLLGVSAATLEEFGAVSGEAVLEMCDGVFEHTNADVALSISGIAGPEGGSADKPVGLVWMCWGKRDKSTYAFPFRFEGEREAVRSQAIEKALTSLLELLRCPEDGDD